MMRHFPKSLNATAGRIEIAKKKFAREFSKLINESALMIWLGLKLR